MGCCKYFCSSIAVALLAFVSQYVYFNVGAPNWWFQARLPLEIEAIDVEDTVKLKRILFSGEPWLLQCYTGLPFNGQHLPQPFRLHPAFLESVGGMRGIVRAGTLDCEKKMPSNKTLVSKFGLVRRTQPLLVFAGGGDKPKQVPAASATSAYGITAWVKPKAEPKVRTATSQKALEAYCGGRRGCLLTSLPADSVVLEQLALRFRTLEVVSVREGDKLSWGRGEEVGETLEPEEAIHFGQSTSLLRADPEAPRPTRKGAKPAPRLLKGHGGSEDLPSLSRFLDKALDEPAETAGGAYVLSPLPTITIKERPKKEASKKKAGGSGGGASDNDNAARQRKRAKARAEAKKKEEKEAKEREEAMKARTAEQRVEMERRRRQQMADEEESAANIVEEADDGEDEDEEGAGGADAEEDVEEVDDFDDEDEAEDDGSDVLDIDA